jgi:hypothetical protein
MQSRRQRGGLCRPDCGRRSSLERALRHIYPFCQRGLDVLDLSHPFEVLAFYRRMGSSTARATEHSCRRQSCRACHALPGVASLPARTHRRSPSTLQHFNLFFSGLQPRDPTTASRLAVAGGNRDKSRRIATRRGFERHAHSRTAMWEDGRAWAGQRRMRDRGRRSRRPACRARPSRCCTASQLRGSSR